MDNTRNDLVREDGPALPGRRQVFRAGIALAVASLQPRNLARAQAQAGPPPNGATPTLSPLRSTLGGRRTLAPSRSPASAWRPEHEPHLSNDDPYPI